MVAITLTAVFRVHDVFVMSSRRVVVIRGEMRSGVVRAGMLLRIPSNYGTDLTAPISSVEAIDGPGFGAATIALVLPYDQPADARLLEKCAAVGEELLLSDAEAGP